MDKFELCKVLGNEIRFKIIEYCLNADQPVSIDEIAEGIRKGRATFAPTFFTLIQNDIITKSYRTKGGYRQKGVVYYEINDNYKPILEKIMLA